MTSYLLPVLSAQLVDAPHTIDMGKPAPGADGLIRFSFTSRLTTPLVPGTTYQASVSAVGPGGTSPSALSNPIRLPFTWCLFAINLGDLRRDCRDGDDWQRLGRSRHRVHMDRNVDASSLTVTSGGIRYRRGLGWIFGDGKCRDGGAHRRHLRHQADFTVTQSGTSTCTYTINQASRTSIAAGESTSVSVASTSTCAWTAVSGAGSITVTAGASGTGNGTVSMTIAANPAAAQRTGTVTIAGHTFTVTQSGTSACTYTINQASRTSIAAGESTSVSVASTSTCAWTAVSGAGSITVTRAGAAPATARSA